MNTSGSIMGTNLIPKEPSMQEIEDSLLRAIEERLAAQKPKWWLALLPAIISAMLAAIIIPWGSWVTRSIADLRAQDGVFSEWRDNVPSVLKTHRLETLAEVTALMENRFGKVEGKLDVLTKQAVENGYDVRRMSELFDLHLRQDGKKPTSSYLPTWPSEGYRKGVWQYVMQTNAPAINYYHIPVTNYYHIPHGAARTDDLYAIAN